MIKVQDFNGKEHVLNLAKAVRSDTQKSSHHLKALEILDTICPSTSIYNEVTLVGCKGVNGVVLCADIFLPAYMCVIEVHGKQHYEFSKFFHKSQIGFYQYKKNDKIKQEWCELNDIKYIELKYNETDSWQKQIYDGITK